MTWDNHQQISFLKKTSRHIIHPFLVVVDRQQIHIKVKHSEINWQRKENSRWNFDIEVHKLITKWVRGPCFNPCQKTPRSSSFISDKGGVVETYQRIQNTQHNCTYEGIKNITEKHNKNCWGFSKFIVINSIFYKKLQQIWIRCEKRKQRPV
jgi:hypothetical protein